MAKYKLSDYKRLLDIICSADDVNTVVFAMMTCFQLYLTGKLSLNHMFNLLNEAAEQIYILKPDE